MVLEILIPRNAVQSAQKKEADSTNNICPETKEETNEETESAVHSRKNNGIIRLFVKYSGQNRYFLLNDIYIIYSLPGIRDKM